MIGFLRYVWKEHRLIGVVTAAAIAALVFFAGGFLVDFVYFMDPANRDRPIEKWMSMRYVERSWGLNKPVMFDLIGVNVNAPPDEVPQSVGDYLKTSGESLSEFQARVEQAQEELRARKHK